MRKSVKLNQAPKVSEMEAKRQADVKKFSGSASGYKHSRPIRKVVKRSFNA